MTTQDQRETRPVVIKLGGEVVAHPDFAGIASDLVQIAHAGLVVVHGGGPQATALSGKLGLETTKVAGRRVTDEATLEVMKMTVGGAVNIHLCRTLLACGAKPVGLNGASSQVISAHRRPPKIYPGSDTPVDLGLVGEVDGLNEHLLQLIIGAGYLPVLACLGADQSGQIFNINADSVANRVACLLRARSLIMISDVPGVLRDKDDPATRIPTIDRALADSLIKDGTIQGGMIPKVEECFEALDNGVQRVHIMGRIEPGDIAREIAEPGSVGSALH